VTVVYTVQIYCHEETNRHSGAMVFLLGHFLSSIPFLFLVSISSSLVFYYLIGLRNEFSFLMYFVLTIFMCLLANEALMMIVAYIWLELYKCTLTLACLHVSVCSALFFFVCMLDKRLKEHLFSFSGYHDACGGVFPKTRNFTLCCMDLPIVLHFVSHIRGAGNKLRLC
jgi:hypothetical protein